MNHTAACSFSFNIRDWRICGDRFADAAQWRAWADGETAMESYKPTLAFLPPMQRRRLSLLARLVFDVAWDLLSENEPCPLVYLSHDGEINRSFALWLDLLRGQEMSPTSFGLSVHNAVAGQWSMFRADMSEHTALAADSGSLENALAEACSWLGESERVLLIAADEPLATDYAVRAVRAPSAYALAMVLERGSDYRLTMLSERTHQAEVADYWGALDWVRFLLSEQREYIHNDGGSIWQWQKTR